MRSMRCVAVWGLLGVVSYGAEVLVPVYGSIAPGDLPAAASGWFATNQPDLFRTLILGQAHVAVPDAQAAALSAALGTNALYRARLVPDAVRTPTGWTIVSYAAKRITGAGTSSGSGVTAVILDAATPATYAPLTAGANPVYVYAISGATVRSATLSDGYLMPTASDAQTFSWSSPTCYQRGTLDASALSAGGARVALLAAARSVPLSYYQGAYVQVIDDVTRGYRYVLQHAITLDDPSAYDPVQYNRALVLGGHYHQTGDGRARCTFTIGSATYQGSFAMADAMTTEGLPDDQLTSASFPATMPDGSPTPPLALPPRAGAEGGPVNLYQQAKQSELPPSVSTHRPILHTEHERGAVPEVDHDGNRTGKDVQFFQPDGGHAQSTVDVMEQVKARRAGTSSADNAPTADGKDRIATKVTGTGASGLDQREAQAGADLQMRKQQQDMQAALTSGAQPSATLDYGTRADGTPNTSTLDPNDLLDASDDALNKQVATTYDDSANPIEPQRKPIVLDASGTVAEARIAGKPDEYYSKGDVVNKLMAPNLEHTTWQSRAHAHHHGALMLPIDFVDAAMVATYGARTGVTIPDKAGDPVPGDGDNPASPLPVGCSAGHPFYDFDDDGDLDRFYTDDPFDGGYKKMKVLWYEMGGGASELGGFPTPTYSVALVGIKKPRRNDAGKVIADEDLVLSVGQNFRPFDHWKLTWRGFKTYYANGFITPLDPQKADDPTLYRFGLRNTVSRTAGTPGVDGAAPDDILPTVGSADVVQVRNLGPGREMESCTVHYAVVWYDRLGPFIDSPPWIWKWSDITFSVPPELAHASVPTIIHETVRDGSGAVISERTLSTPVAVDDGDGSEHPFDLSLIPMETPAIPGPPVADTYMWDYPTVKSTAEGGTGTADPQSYVFPWNLAWRGKSDLIAKFFNLAKQKTDQAFRLNSADMGRFPGYADLKPKITHAGLVNDASGTVMVEWLLRENTAANPPGPAAAWVDGTVLYTAPGWLSPMPWIDPGRATFHVAPWDGRTDIYGPGRGIGNVRIPSGQRLFDVVGGFTEYLFRGKKIRPKTVAEQIALLRRMWNYDFTGRELPAANETCLYSVCIPQRFNNWNLASPALNTATVAPGSARVERSESGGGLTGPLLASLASPEQANERTRQATERRARLMKEQIFLFSAARGREWELDMARRMPHSVRLICLEYDDKEAIKAVLGKEGGNVYFPETRSLTLTDPTGGRHDIESSNEEDIIKEICLQWLDHKEPYIGMNGQDTMGVNGDFGQKSFGENRIATVKPDTLGDFDGIPVRIDGSMPAGLAAYACTLRSWPMNDSRQWAPDAAQPFASSMTIQFRHPMLVLYHDRASSVYIHYGRNADPKDVFTEGWDQCAPPPGALDISSGEFARRQRFETYLRSTDVAASAARIEHIYDLLHPAGYADLLASNVTLPEAPPEPGIEPATPTFVDWPGNTPHAPAASLQNWDGYGTGPTFTPLIALPTPALLAGYSTAWALWRDLSGYDGLEPQAQYAKYLDTVTVHYDTAVTGWLRVRMSGQGGGGTASLPAVWTPDDVDALYPMGIPGTNASSYLFGQVPAAVTFPASVNFDAITFSDLASGATVAGQYWPSSAGISVPSGELRALASNDPNDEGRIHPRDAAGHDVSWASIAHPMTIPYYQALALKPQVDWYQAIFTQRSTAITQFASDTKDYQDRLASWQKAAADYKAYEIATAEFPAKHAAWASAKALWDGWASQNADLLRLVAKGQVYREDRGAWVALVVSAASESGVSWPGDEAVALTTPEQFAILSPRMPVWDAYLWFIDPANAVPEASGD